jgi:putative membrane-bound dehydrogenase-like protein
MRSPLPIAAAALLGFASFLQADDSPRRVSVLFFGAPTENHPGHDPITRYRSLKKQLGTAGIDLTYSEDPEEVFTPEILAQYDGLLMYGNWEQNGTLPAEQEKALFEFVEGGGGFIPVHCASACYGASENFVKLVGGRFKSHGEGEFEPKTVLPNHPAMKGYTGFSAWDESYVHDGHGDDRTVLQTRDGEPWTWVRTQGKGFVFYTASGHDHRVWDLPEFADLLRRGILWSVGDEARSRLIRLKLPQPKLIDVELPGYRNQQLVTKLPEPLSPTESMKLAQVPTGFELSLFAADPDIVNPIFISWDENGRAWVIETIDYPNNLQANNLGHDRITICEDTDNDGKADKFTRFAEKLSIPSTLAFVHGGVICTNGSEVLFLKDTDGDDKADIRVPLFNGLRTGDTHAGVSNFRMGPDNWIYATTGYSGIGGTIGKKTYDFSQALFRFKINFPEKITAGADGTMQENVTLEVLQNTTNNTWGLGFTNDFDIMGSTANGNPSWYFTFAKDIYESAGIEQPRTPQADNNPFFYPSSMDIRQVDQFDKFTAAAGHALYTGSRFPDGYRDKIAFVCGPTGKLVANFHIEKDSSGFTATQSPNNLYNSADAWSAPVCAEVGPDGAVWICDWYNMVIQHNPTPNKGNSGLDGKNGRGNAYMTPHRDIEHGRIYRVYPKGSVNVGKPDSLTAAVSSPDLFWRTTAQRMIIDSGDKSQAAALKDLVRKGDSPAAINAFGTLQGLGLLDLETITSALKSAAPGLRRMALAFAPLDNTLVDLFTKDGKITEADPRTRMELYLALSRLAPSEEFAKALAADLGDDADQALLDAWQVAARRNQAAVLAKLSGSFDKEKTTDTHNLLPNPDFSKTTDGKPTGWSDLRLYAGAEAKNITLSTDPTGGRDGSPALKITATQNSDCGAAIVIPVEPNTSYHLSGWIKTKDVDAGSRLGCMMNIHTGGHTNAVKGTSDWTLVEMDFTTGSEREALIHCLFGGYGGATGTAWWDDVSLTKTSSSNPANAAVALLKAFKPGAGDAEIVRKFTIDPAVHARGKAVFDLTCIACHGPDGNGVEGAFPPINGSDWLTGDPAIPAKIIIHGLQGPINVNGKDFNGIMPPLVDLKDAQIADVLTYARQSWKNDAAPVTPDQVKQARSASAGQQGMLKVEDLKR